MKNLNDKKVSIVTVTLECKDSQAPDNGCRYEILEKVVQTFGKKDIILFPGGFYDFPALGSAMESEAVDNIRKLLSDTKSNAIVCLGIDAEENDKSEQFAVAVNRSGIVAKGRKFYPTEDDIQSGIQLAKSFDSKESGYERFFECKGKRFYLAVCYDVFGIRDRKIANPGTDAVLNHVHFFTPRGKGSGFSYFIRYGFGGASLHWNCPVFGAAVFFERKVPASWQPGFQCRNKIEKLQSITYKDNALKSDKQDCDISTEYEKAFYWLYTV